MKRRTMKKQFFQYLVIVLSFFAILYGVTYQQFRHFDVTDPRGANDSISYIKMSHNDYNVSPVHKYRFVIPSMAKFVGLPLKKVIHDEQELDKLSFYIVNFAFTFASSVLLLELLRRLGFEMWLSILGVIIFLSSRITILVTGTPLVDSFYFMSVVLILLLTLIGSSRYLALSMPLLALSKETIIPFLFIPLFTKMRTSKSYLISLAISLGLIYCTRHGIDRLTAHSNVDLFSIIQGHAKEFQKNTAAICSLGGLHDIQNGFSLFLVYAILGYCINCKRRLYHIPMYFNVLIPLCLFFALLSGNLGRMFFAGFPVVIPYVLIFFAYVYQRTSMQGGTIAQQETNVSES